MKVRIHKKIVLFTSLLVGVFVLIGMFSYYWTKVRDPYPDVTANATAPFFPRFHFFLQQDAWKIDTFQPIVVDYYSRDGNNYLVGQYQDIGGFAREVEMFVSGTTVDKSVVDVAVFSNGSEMYDFRYTFDQVREKYPIGSQALIYYISESPNDDEFRDLQPFMEFFNPILPVYSKYGTFDVWGYQHGEFFISGVGEVLYVE